MVKKRCTASRPFDQRKDVFCILGVDLRSNHHYIVECSKKKKDLGTRTVFARSSVNKLDLIFEEDRRINKGMKKVIALSAVLVMGALGMACGEAPANNANTTKTNTTNTTNTMSSNTNGTTNTTTTNTTTTNSTSTTNTGNANVKPITNVNANANVKKP